MDKRKQCTAEKVYKAGGENGKRSYYWKLEPKQLEMRGVFF